MNVLAADAPASGNTQLLTAALLGIAVVVLLITWAKVHPFLALILGAAVLGLVAGFSPEETIDSFTGGVGTTVGGVGLLIALGAMIGGLLAESGGADRIVDAVVGRFAGHALPWAMAGVAALIGLPLFFEVGVVLLVPVVLLVATRTGLPVLAIGIPALAGLSVLHGLVPPHPGPLAAIDALNADLGLTLLFGLIVAVPTVVLAGPVFGGLVSRYVHTEVPAALVPGRDQQERAEGADGVDRRPGVAAAVLAILLPVVLMLLRAIAELTLPEDDSVRKALEVAGEPVVALLAGVLVAMVTLGYATGRSRAEVSATLGGALPAIAGILLIVGAGGGFKQVLVDAGVAQVITDWASGANLSALVLAWLAAVGIRVATGSATVATITAAGIVSPLAQNLDKPEVALMVLAVGSGSLFFSHVNDAGFWLVKEYFGMTVGQTLKTWSVMETIISVVGLAGVLLLNLVV
ncbi:GntP family permease [Spongisporangium articulatum]|uniref:GntP family permease n=1 Tax=Spongisporangium articulatum TaxID=3362603 RepID=A0ABW8APG9_9ACTN